MRIQYGVEYPQGEVALANRNNDLAPYPTFPELIGGLNPEPAAEYPVAEFDAHRQKWGVFYMRKGLGRWPGVDAEGRVRLIGGSLQRTYLYNQVPEAMRPRNAAVVPVWLTVVVPKDAGSGKYQGVLRIEMTGEKAMQVPVELNVADFTLPNKDDYLTEVDLIQSPDTLALEYNVPLWSEKHWEMIGESLRMLGDAGCRTVYVPLIGHTNIGNEESMVRWVKKADGTYEHDFSIMERYLDTAETQMGKPRRIIFLVWDVYMMPKDPDTSAGAGGGRDRITRENLEKKGVEVGHGPMVTVVDKATGKTELVELPTLFEGEASKPLWKPLFDGLHARLKKRGLDEAMTLGLLYDTWATKEEVGFLKEVAGDVPWAMHSHEGFSTHRDKEGRIYGIAKVGYQARVWTVYYGDDGAWSRRGDAPRLESRMGWSRRDVIITEFARWVREQYPSTYWRGMAETNVTGEQTGIGRIGGDLWKVLKDKKDRRMGRAFERYPESNWRNLIIVDAVLAPGEKGAIETHRLVAMREGVQESEARIMIERALSDQALRAKLGEDLVKRCEMTLEGRHRMLWLSMSSLQLTPRKEGEKGHQGVQWRGGVEQNVTGHQWFLGSGYRERSRELFELAGAVQKRIGL